jgi:hypothetical protein
VDCSPLCGTKLPFALRRPLLGEPGKWGETREQKFCSSLLLGWRRLHLSLLSTSNNPYVPSCAEASALVWDSVLGGERLPEELSSRRRGSRRSGRARGLIYPYHWTREGLWGRQVPMPWGGWKIRYRGRQVRLFVNGHCPNATQTSTSQTLRTSLVRHDTLGSGTKKIPGRNRCIPAGKHCLL